jgi:hypothetical protein
MESFLLEVKTSELTQALRNLCKVEKGDGPCHLTYGNRLLTISTGRSHQDVAAQGSWPVPVFVPRRWAETLAARPYDVSLTTLRISENKFWARDWGCDCSFGSEHIQDEDAIARRKNIAAAAKVLSRHQITEREIEKLIEEADGSKAALWSPDDDRIVSDIASAWMSLFSYGVEPSDIKRSLQKRSREMWVKPPVRRT